VEALQVVSPAVKLNQLAVCALAISCSTAHAAKKAQNAKALKQINASRSFMGLYDSATLPPRSF